MDAAERQLEEFEPSEYEPGEEEPINLPSIDLPALSLGLTASDNLNTGSFARGGFSAQALQEFALRRMNEHHLTIPAWNLDRAYFYPVQDDIRVIRSEIEKLTGLGVSLLQGEQPGPRLSSISREHFTFPEHEVWVDELEELDRTDVALLHCMVDALYLHTSPNLFRRWESLRIKLKAKKEKLEKLINHAELAPRPDWHPLVSEFYFLLLE